MKCNHQTKREAKRLFHQCVVNGLVDESSAREAASRVLVAGRRNARVLMTHFLRLIRLDHARHAANIESAVPLTPELKATLEAGLARRFGPGLTASFASRPELIGGVRVRVGCDLYDDTVMARLEGLEKKF